jgi:hypothetical protein
MIMPDRVLIRADVLRSLGLDTLNDGLHRAGLGRPLEPAAVSASATATLVALPLPGVDVAAALTALRRTVDDPAGVLPDVRYGAGTAGQAQAGTFIFLGEKTGHGLVSWVPVEEAEMGPRPAWRALRRRPVVALLDSGVRRHPWLPDPVEGQAFVVDAPDWVRHRPLDIASLPDIAQAPNYGSHLGHATFIAGIIRRVAPDAQVLSVKVMDDLGQVNEENVVAALEWLLGHVTAGATVDVALLAFGRRVANGEDHTNSAERVSKAIEALADHGVRVVISAGNGGNTDPVFPASHARAAGDHAVSVGAGLSMDFPEQYSSRGDWVTDWRLGGDVVSLMPLTPTPSVHGNGFARWSGTSFAAAIRAAEYAAEIEPVV